MFRTACALALSLAAGVVVLAADVSFEEVKKQEEFKKAYVDRSQPDHLKTLALLAGATHPSTWEILSTVAAQDPSKEVRAAAFKMLCPMPARTPKLAEQLVALFKEVKFNEADVRSKYAEEMGKSEFKYSIYEALADYGSKMRYPDLVTGNVRGGLGGGDPNKTIRKTREDFENYVQAFNSVTGASIGVKDNHSPDGFKKWWAENKMKILAADRAKAQKYAAEDEAAAHAKGNPLLPKSEQKKTQ